jgi:hypothetical protein
MQYKSINKLMFLQACPHAITIHAVSAPERVPAAPLNMLLLAGQLDAVAAAVRANQHHMHIGICACPAHIRCADMQRVPSLGP